MRVRTLLGAAVLSLAAVLTIPATADAAHRHSRHCRHRTHHTYVCRSDCGRQLYGYSYRYNDGYDYGYNDDYRYNGYADGYVYNYYYRPSRPVVPYHRHGRGRSRPHVGLHFRW